MAIYSILGIMAAVLTTGAFIPQAYRIIKTRSTKDLSVTTFTMLCVGTVCWFLYGVFLRDFPLILANGITASLTGIILYFKITSKEL